MTKQFITALVLASVFGGSSAWAACQLVSGGAKTPFDGKSLDGVQVEKKSLVSLGKEFPGLGVVEKAFKGEVQTCTSCTDKYVTCE